MTKTLTVARDEYLDQRVLYMAANTARTDKLVINRFIKVVGDLQVQNVTEDHVAAFVRSRSQTCKPSSVNTELTTMRAFYNWNVKRRYCPALRNPFGDLSYLPTTPRDRLFIPVGSFNHLMDSAPTPRHRVIVALGLFLFLRQSEVCTIQMKDVHLDRGVISIRVHKSGGWIDDMPISEELDAELRRWLEWYGSRHDLGREDYLVPYRPPGHPSFRTEEGKRVFDSDPEHVRLVPGRRTSRVTALVQDVLADAGFPVELEGGHTLRRSGALARYEALVDIGHDGALREVQAMLHHASITTTEKYLNINIERARRNANLIGRPMFPGVTASNVVPLRRTAEA